jgi:hypothetical protein
MAEPHVHGIAHFGGGYCIGVVTCERCGLNYTFTGRAGYRYRLLCSVCAAETGETVETPIAPAPSPTDAPPT